MGGARARGALASLSHTKIHPTRNQGPDNARIWRINWGGRGRDTDAWRDLQHENSPGADRDLGAGQGWQRGDHTVPVNGGRRRHTERGAGTSGGGWRVAGAGDVQVGGVSHQERRWGAGEEREGSEDECMQMGRQ